MSTRCRLQEELLRDLCDTMPTVRCARWAD